MATDGICYSRKNNCMRNNTENEEKYITYYFIDRPVASVPTEPRWLRGKIPVCLRATTLRKKIFKTGLGVVLNTGMDGLIGSEGPLPVVHDRNIVLSDILRSVASTINASALYPVIVYPALLNRNRFYVYLFTRGRNIIGFIKAGFGKDNAVAFEREQGMLHSLRKKRNFSFKVPEVFMTQNTNNLNYIVFSSLPDTIRPVGKKGSTVPEKFSRELSQCGTATYKVRELSWWTDFKNYNNGLTDLHAFIDNNIYECDTTWVHGDLTIENIYADHEDYWIVDWENSAQDGPLATDRIVYDLNLRSRKIMRNPHAAIVDLWKKYFKNTELVHKYNFALAIAFLCTRYHRGAEICMKNWKIFTGGNR